MKEAVAVIMTTSMRLAENGGERHLEDLVIIGVADMHDPVAPVFRAAFADHQLHHAGRVVARLGKVATAPDWSIRTSFEFEQWK